MLYPGCCKRGMANLAIYHRLVSGWPADLQMQSGKQGIGSREEGFHPSEAGDGLYHVWIGLRIAGSIGEKDIINSDLYDARAEHKG